MKQLRLLPDTAAIARAAADAAIKDLRAALDTYNNATWVIAGGSTPMIAYALMAANAIDALDWSKVNIIIGDERCVPFDSPDASWTLAERTLLQHLPLASMVARPATNLIAEEAAASYDTYLRSLPLDSAGLPRLDHVWLGVGEDGHTLSLFPNHRSSLVDSTDDDKLVIAVHDSPKPPPNRISLTFRALQGTKNCVIMASGTGKADAVSRALNGDTSLPIAQAAATIAAAGGKIIWLLDTAAGSGS